MVVEFCGMQTEIFTSFSAVIIYKVSGISSAGILSKRRIFEKMLRMSQKPVDETAFYMYNNSMQG